VPDLSRLRCHTVPIAMPCRSDGGRNEPALLEFKLIVLLREDEGKDKVYGMVKVPGIAGKLGPKIDSIICERWIDNFAERLREYPFYKDTPVTHNTITQESAQPFQGMLRWIGLDDKVGRTFVVGNNFNTEGMQDAIEGYDAFLPTIKTDYDEFKFNHDELFKGAYLFEGTKEAIRGASGYRYLVSDTRISRLGDMRAFVYHIKAEDEE